MVSSLLNPQLSPLNLDEEYNNALRSKSYIDIYSKLHHHQKNEDDQSHSAKDHEDEKLQYYEVEHTNQSLVDNLDQEEPACSRHFRNLLLDFFDTTRQSSDALSSLLSSLSLAKSHHRSIHRLLTKLISKSPNCSPQLSSTYYYSQLSSQLDRENPLSTKNLATFHAAHGRYRELIQHLNSANRRIDRRLRIRRLVFCLRECRRKLERVKRRVDGARRGAYIVGRDMDTVSRMVRRVEDEVEHEREVGRMVVRFMKKDDDKEEWGIVREVVKEIEGRRGGRGREGEEEEELGLEEQVEELEEHVYLCLITINRSRKMVALDAMEHHET